VNLLSLNENNYKQLLEKIIQSDDIIRFTAICDTNFGTIEEQLQRDGQTLLLSEYDTDKLIRGGVDSWHYRKQLSNKIGNGQYAMAVYDKIIRLTIPLNENHFLLVTLDNVEKTPKIVDTIKKILSE
jgi:hypothetical protein